MIATAVLSCLLGACAREPLGVEVPEISSSTALEREQTIDGFEENWANRSTAVTPANERAQRAFVRQLLKFAGKIDRTPESGRTRLLLYRVYDQYSRDYPDVPDSASR